MQQEIYPNQVILPPRLRRFRMCGVFDMQYGGPMACFLWIVINMYTCVLSFQSRSPIYSYLNRAALIVQGIVCLWFVVTALVSLYSFTLNRPKQLRRSHRLTWTSVLLLLIVYFVNMILFCAQKDQFINWCISKSQTDTMNILSSVPNNSTVFSINHITSFNSSQVTGYVTIQPGSDLYNCTRLWADEVKFSVIVFVILFVHFVHSAVCFWYYTEWRSTIIDQLMEQHQVMTNNMHINPNPMINNPNMVRNIKPGTEIAEYQDDGQRSLAQLARAAFGRLR